MLEKKALRGINPGFALDHMEPMRPVVDRAVLQLIDAVAFTGADSWIQHDGVCRMNPELARREAQLAWSSVKSSTDRVARPLFDPLETHAFPHLGHSKPPHRAVAGSRVRLDSRQQE
jgi:hypothetical protein